jgi:antirestriction protein
MKTNTMTTPTDARVYVGTYAKYNAGSIKGEWVNLDDYAGDREGFLAKCREIHADEADPELMFQDFEGFPREFYGESGLSPSLFEWLEMDEWDRELMARYQDATGTDDATLDQARDAYSGTYDSGADAARRMAEDLGEVPKDLPAWIVIDWEASWNCNLRHDYSTSTDDDGRLWLFHV